MARPKTTELMHKLPLDLIDDPDVMKRENMGDEEEIMSLGKDMRDNGQIQPVVVFKKGERYGLIAGHRRVYAARRAGMVALWAVIHKGDIRDIAIKRFQENKQRLQNSPWEEAVFLQEMLDNLGGTQVELANTLKVSAAYVAQRLAVLRGYPCVQQALREGLINFAQCRELLQFPDESLAKHYLAITVEGGAKSELIRRWRNEIELTYKKVEETPGSIEELELKRKLVQMQLQTCEVCNTVIDPINIIYLKVCSICHKTLVQSIEKFRK